MTVTLVTGGSGFIGRHIIEALSQQGDQTVHSVSRSIPQTPLDGVTYHQADLLDIQTVQSIVKEVKPENIIHLAWDARPGLFWNSSENLNWVASSIALFDVFCEQGGKRFVGAGTCAEYEWKENLFQEKVTPYIPHTLYGSAKSALRDMLEKSAALRDVSFAWGHVFFLFGPGEPLGKLVSSAYETFNKGEAFATTLGYQLRDFMYVKDVAAAYVQLLNSDVTGAVNIASGNQIALREILSELNMAIGKGSMIDFGALPYRSNEPMSLGADTKRLNTEVGFLPKFDLKSALQDYVKSSSI